MSMPIDPPKEDKKQQIFNLINNAIDAKIQPLYNDIKQQREQLDSITKELGNTNQSLNQTITTLNQLISTLQQPQESPKSEQNILSSGLSPELKAQAISSLGQTLASIIQAWKGSSGAAPDPMSEMGKQLMADLFRATVDDIQQRVYGIRKIPPPNILPRSHSLE